MNELSVLLNDGMNKEGIEIFTRAGIETSKDYLEPDVLQKSIGNFDALVVRSKTKVTREIIEEGAKGNLKVIGRAGVGVDNIDVTSATENGIIVKFAPNGVTTSTAEMALGLMFAVSRKIPQSHMSLTNEIWLKKPYEGAELSRKTLGIIGCGRIGQRLSQIVRGLDMKVIGCDENLRRVQELFPDSAIEYTSMDDVLKQADYVSLHTGGKSVIIGAKEIELMKPSAYLINASRGGNVDNETLYEALKNKRIAGAGFDVHLKEPKKEGEVFESRFKGLENVVLTSHLGASTKEGQRKTSEEMARVIVDYLCRGDYANAVNVGENIESGNAENGKIYTMFIHNEDKPGVFAQVDSILGKHGINIRETSSRKIGEGKGNTVYCLNSPVTYKVLEEIKAIPEVLRVSY